MPTRAFSFLIVAVAAQAALQGADWPCWRGPQHDGICLETNLNVPWDASPKVLWELTTGSAFSSVAVVGDLAYTCGTEDGKQVLFCVNADSGKVVWKAAFAPAIVERQGGDGPRATPAVDGGKVYIFGGEGTLLCANAETGAQIWSKKFSSPPQWKYSGSVLIEGPMAVISPGGADGGLLALNKENGEVVWKGGQDGAGYATPYPFTFQGQRYIVGVLAKTVIIVEAESGREVWSMPWVTDYDVNASTPIYHDGRLFVSSGYKHGCMSLQLQKQGDRLTTTTAWEGKVLANRFQTCILLDGKLYGADEQMLKCVNFLTGEQVWRVNEVEGDRTLYGTVVLCQGHLIFLSEKGKLSVAKASPAGFQATGATQVLEGRCWTVPTLSNGRLYVRNFEKLVCLDLRK